MNSALIVFIKNPVPGKCKTRLAASIGDSGALEVYLKLLMHTRNTCLQINNKKFLFYSNHIDLDDEWDNEIFEKKLQDPSDLGQRMKIAFEDILKSHDSAVIIGSDCPQINSRIINQAFEALKYNDFVLGPSEDGGYYLLGLKKMIPNFFDDMVWSTATVYSETISRIKQMKCSLFELQTLTDLDNFEDLKRFPELMP